MFPTISWDRGLYCRRLLGSGVTTIRTSSAWAAAAELHVWRVKDRWSYGTLSLPTIQWSSPTALPPGIATWPQAGTACAARPPPVTCGGDDKASASEVMRSWGPSQLRVAGAARVADGWAGEISAFSTRRGDLTPRAWVMRVATGQAFGAACLKGGFENLSAHRAQASSNKVSLTVTCSGCTQTTPSRPHGHC